MIHSRRFIALTQVQEETGAARPPAQAAVAKAAMQGPVTASGNRAPLVSRS